MKEPDVPAEDQAAILEDERTRLDAELARLRESERKYRYSAALAGRLVWVADAEGKMIFLDEPFVQLTGMSAGQGLGTGWFGVLHPDDREPARARWTRSVETGEIYESEFRVLRVDGEYRTTRSRAVATRSEDGTVRRWYGTTEDVEDEVRAEAARHAAEEALREAEARYRLAALATNDAIWDCDLVEDVIDWGENAAPVLGVAGPLGRTAGTWWGERLHPEERLAVLTDFDDAIVGDASRWSRTYRFRRDDGSYADIFDRGFIIRDAKGKAVRAVGAMQDLTERNRAEAEIRRMQAELIHVSRLSAMGTMASTLAHELNQPLAAIGNFLSGTKRIAERPDMPREILIEALDGAEAAARRAGEILRRLRDLVSRGKVSVQVEHLPPLIEEACVLALVEEAALGIRHRLVLDPKAEWVRVDRIQVQQVLINLLRNAVEAMTGSGGREVRIETRAAGAMVEIEVADTGPGIADRHMESLFSEFMTTKSEGMGLGLPISRTIVEAHGGAIRAENRAGGGAAFVFTLPKAKRKRV
jgi:two-component system sensor kinase FixL